MTRLEAEINGKIAMNCGSRKKSARLEKSTRLALCAQSKNALYAFEISADYINQLEYGRKLALMVSDTTSSHTFFCLRRIKN
jgi:hypothetical protein